MKFTKKPVVIEAHQWFKNGDHPEDESSHDPHYKQPEGKVVMYFRRPDISGNNPCQECGDAFHVHGWIDTIEGGHRVCPGDWIITGVQGEKYPCKPDIFEKTYNKGDMSIRDEVQQFMKAMEERLRANDHKTGWSNKSQIELFRRLTEEVGKLSTYLFGTHDEKEFSITRKAANAANFAMMIADNWGAKFD